jgi:hypothetical protein
MRALGRAREEALRALKTAQCRLQAFLLRHAIRSTGRAPWGPAHLRGLSEVVWPTPAPQSVLHASMRAVTEHTERLARLAQERTDQGPTWRRPPGVDALQALRGVPFTVAVTLVAERGDLTRFENPCQLRHSLGLTPSAYAPGERRRPGGSTKTGNSHARRALVAGAWAYRAPATGSRHLQLRLEKGPKPIQEMRWQAQGRRCKRSRPLLARGKNAHQVVVARARELRACMWAIAQAVPLTPESEPLPGRPPLALGCPGAADETQPRCGGTRDGVTRRHQTPVPRARQAPDGRQEGGTQSTHSRRSNRRLLRAPPLPMDAVQEDEEQAKQSVAHS